MTEILINKNDLFIQIIRQKKSRKYKHNINLNTSYKNNTKNNSLDTLELFRNDKIIFESTSLQTVANHPFMRFKDTIGPGNFQIKCFVNSRKFNGRIHGIINTKDIENQDIGQYSMQIENGEQKGRWVVHNKFYNKTHKETKYAYSGGCFIFSVEELKQFNKILLTNGIEDFYKSGSNKHYVINGNLKEV